MGWNCQYVNVQVTNGEYFMNEGVYAWLVNESFLVTNDDSTNVTIQSNYQ